MINCGAHLTHCNFGEEFGRCKYGEPDCPALKPWSPQNTVRNVLLGEWMMAVAIGSTESSFSDWVGTNHPYWQAMLDAIYAELDVGKST